MRQHETIVIIGATSSIAREMANEYAEMGYCLILLGRNLNQLRKLSTDIQIRYGVPVSCELFEASDYTLMQTVFTNITANHPSIVGLIVAFGYLGRNLQAEKDFQEAIKILQINYVSSCLILSLFANYFEKTKRGFIIGLSSVAGDRGRFSNYFYGSAKGGFSLFLQGLRARLYHSNVHVLTAKPGFTDTKMTYGKPGMFLVATPKKVAQDIIKAQIKKKNEIYTPWFWKYILGITKQIPESLFKRLKM